MDEDPGTSESALVPPLIIVRRRKKNKTEAVEISGLRLINTIKLPATAVSSAGVRALLLLAFGHTDADAASQWFFWRALLNSVVFVFHASVGARGLDATPTQIKGTLPLQFWHFGMKCVTGRLQRKSTIKKRILNELVTTYSLLYRCTVLYCLYNAWFMVVVMVHLSSLRGHLYESEVRRAEIEIVSIIWSRSPSKHLLWQLSY